MTKKPWFLISFGDGIDWEEVIYGPIPKCPTCKKKDTDISARFCSDGFHFKPYEKER